MRLRLTIFLDSVKDSETVKNMIVGQNLVTVCDQDHPVMDIVPVDIDQNGLKLVLEALASLKK